MPFHSTFSCSIKASGSNTDNTPITSSVSVSDTNTTEISTSISDTNTDTETTPSSGPQEPLPQLETPKNLPLRRIPGDYGLPFVGPIKDRLDYFYNEGRDKFFRTRINKYKSTKNETSSPELSCLPQNSRAVTESSLTSTPPNQNTNNSNAFSFSSSNLEAAISSPSFFHLTQKLFDTLEKDLENTAKAVFADANDQEAFNYLSKAFYGVNPSETSLKTEGPSIVTKWTLLQLGPILTLGLPKCIEEPLLHTVRLPPALVKKDYQRLYDFFYEASSGPI
ncbi:hypothetical protein KIW84_013066 [Lathyrus oleraceus]|uniref:Uncharacterized protein n=1 Tax=Pisum sativum TaxID=3888 RepID=A0A9D5GXL3_PEA|nr:hypothetical protein KIW84_013066 [Pisum sativum]